jgi:hypothetical protein
MAATKAPPAPRASTYHDFLSRFDGKRVAVELTNGKTLEGVLTVHADYVEIGRYTVQIAHIVLIGIPRHSRRLAGHRDDGD